jgi:hypothetical protein
MDRKKTYFFLTAGAVSILSRVLTLYAPEIGLDETTVGIMSLRVLSGDFPVFFFGQNFMGSLEAFLGGTLFHLFNASPRVLVFMPVFFSLLFLFLLYSFSQKIFDSSIAMISTWVLAIPPFFLLIWSHEVRIHYHLVNFFGGFLLLISHRLSYSRVSVEQTRLLFLLLGLIAGLAWWTNYLIVVYILPIGLFLFLKDKKILFRKDFWGLLFFFLLGSLPLWIYNLLHHFPIAQIIHAGGTNQPITYLKEFFVNAFPILLGFLPPLGDDYFDLASYLIIGSMFLMGVCFYIYRFRQAINPLLRLRLPQTKGGEILIFIFMLNIGLNLFTHFGSRLNDNDQKYLFPLYICLPIFLAVFLMELRKKSSMLLYIGLGLVITSNLAGDLRHRGWTVFDSKEYGAFKERDRKQRQLVDFLKEKRFNRLYAGLEGYQVALRSQGAVVSSHPYQEGCLKIADLVDGSSRPAYLSQGEDLGFEANLKAIGGSYQKIQAPEGYLLYTDFIPPEGAYRQLSRTLWTAISNRNPLATSQAFDGNISTGWGTGTQQDRGTFFLLDFGKQEEIGKVTWFPANYRQIPTSYEIMVSLDGKNWASVVRVPEYRGPIFWSGPNPLVKIRHGRIEAVFQSQTCRFLKIQLLSKGNEPWSINELFVYAPAGQKKEYKTPFDEKETQRILSFLEGQGVRYVYADHWLSALLRVNSHWTMGAWISNAFLGDNGEDDPEAERFDKAVLTEKVALIVEQDRGQDLDQILVGNGYRYQKDSVAPFWVYHHFTRPEGSPYLSMKGVKVSSNVNASQAGKAVDGRKATRWTCGKPQSPGVYFEIDLGAQRTVRGCTLFLENSVDDFPRGLKLLSSMDGQTWQELPAMMGSELYWTGKTLIPMIGSRIYYFFPARSLRFLRLVQTGYDPIFYWSIHELKLF